ncbi:hypothetical protein [Luteimonas sp. MC1572]|uniref:hypothetical protein n=1 Tax=Luteimonas sp. MC1572 TaxID=2799325 RepID=UPI0018F0BB86|nr:hypothetical protein [Luteimonas sp. MC1572]MBJ6980919.1 hypothetical protein [Luteimonas sp. MC1572]QQO02275.1 hypothetical protein JGR64_08600 [Luteimonas sp. MC1572]
MRQNVFLKKLLALQQDGSGAISSPSNWLRQPLLRVETPTLACVKGFAESIATATTPHWLVLVGGPGNGKSLAVQQLAHALLDAGYQIKDETGVSIEAMASRPVPAVLEVRGVDGTLVARIAQDASVVPNPYATAPNPAADLHDLFKRCIEDGCHLVACANRGVLEAAAALLSAEGADGPTELVQVLASTGHRTKEVSSQLYPASGVTLTARAMDSGSLFEGDDPVFLQLLRLATAQEHWQSCQSCPLAAVCPFLLNRNELATEPGTRTFARLCEDAELLDGQPLVFREASALVSLILAGCAADYEAASPCDWVHRQATAKAWFRLAARRSHMMFFSSQAPLGIDRNEDVHALSILCDQAGIGGERILCEPPSTRVGLARMLGANGVMQQLDPLAAPLRRDLMRWGDGFAAGEQLSDLEQACQGIWDELDAALQEPRPDSAVSLAALARWRTSHSLRFGALWEGAYALRDELHRFREAIGVPRRPPLGERAHLTKMLRGVLDSEQGIRVASHVRIDSSALTEVNVDWNESYARRTICIVLGDGSAGVLAQISAAAFVWLVRRHDAPLHDGTFPVVWLQAARDSIARAASASMYSRMPSGGVLIEGAPSGVIRVMWESREVEAQLVSADG